jgi:1,2-diacylglycerol 3-alpha-glucosyltransferase
MKIVHLCLCGPFNQGWGYQENYLSYYHKKLGFDVSIIGTPFINDKSSTGVNKVEPGTLIDKDEIKLIRLPLSINIFPRLCYTLGIYKGLFETLKDEKPDILFIHGIQFMGIYTVRRYLRENPNVLVYIDNHSDENNSARNIISRNIKSKILWRRCAIAIEPYVRKFWGVTPSRCDYLVNMYHVKKEKVNLLVMGADDEKIHFKCRDEIRASIREKLGISKSDFVVVSGGKIDARKNIHLLMQAIINLNIANIKLVVFGTPDNEMSDIIQNLSKHSCINYIGWIESKEVYNYYLASDLAVFPGMHSVLWEQAVASGIPCVFKAWKGMNHVDVGGNCIFLEYDDIGLIAKTINNLYNDKEKYNSMKMVAGTKGVSEFLYSEIAKRSIEFRVNYGLKIHEL